MHHCAALNEVLLELFYLPLVLLVDGQKRLLDFVFDVLHLSFVGSKIIFCNYKADNGKL